MSFSGESIRQKSKSAEEFEKGKELFQRGKVRFLSDESFWKGEEKLKVSVEDGKRSYQASLLIKGGCIYQAACQCPVHREYKGLCCHEVAAAFYAMEKREGENAPHVSTPVEVRRMLQNYTSRGMTELMVSKMEEKVRLEPVFRVVGGTVRMSLMIGTSRMYQVKDLAAFAEALEVEAYVEYGKQLGFYHSPEAFEEESRRLAEEVSRVAGEYLYLYGKMNPLRASSHPVLRELELSPAACDSMMKLLTGQTVEFELPGGQQTMLQIRKENPRLFGVIRAFGKDGFRISLLDGLLVFQGKKRLYLIRGEVLYCCDRAATAVLRDFLGAMEKNAADGSLSAEIGEKDLPSFCDYVLPKLSPYVSLEPMGVNLEQYHTEPLQVKFYFDSPTESEITLQAEFWYGDEMFTPFSHGERSGVIRDQVGELMVGTVIKKYFTGRYADKSRFTIWDDEDVMFRLLNGGMEEFEKCGQVFLSASMRERKVLPEKRLSFGISMENGWLDLKVEAGDLPQAEINRILSAYRMKKNYYRLKSGDFIRLSDSGFGTLLELTRGLSLDERQSFREPLRLPGYRSLYVDKVLKEGRHVEVSRDSAFKALIRVMNSPTEGDFQVPDSLRSVLRKYQKQGFFWMRTLDSCGFGGILADDMGLGKTIQIIALLVDEGRKNPDMEALIVCPASLIYNWESEIQRFGKELSVMVVAGVASEREAILKGERGKAQVYITSYDLLRRDIALYRDRSFRFQIIDEAQYIKNHATQNARAVKKIRAAGKFALTGTPIENRLTDLWSIFDFLMPGFLYSYPRFKKEFEIPVVRDGDKGALKRLHRMIGPFLLRRYKKDVLKDLPDKLEHTVYSGLEGSQRKLYTAHALRLKDRLQSSGEEEYQKERMQILSELLRLRQICCDPGLCYEDYKGSSAKLETCMELILSGAAANHKLLVFSQFASMLDILGERLTKEGIAYYKLTGQTGKEERLRLVNAFNQDEVPVFLISLKAGGTGLNLTAADVVIHYDPWWNLAAQNQATDRAHRIGQKKRVSVFRLIARDTIEEGVLKLQEQKRELNEQVVEEASSFASMSRTELIRLLEEEHEVY